MGLATFTPEVKDPTAEYAEQAKEFVAAAAKGGAIDESVAWEESFPTTEKRDGTRDDGHWGRANFQGAVRKLGYTARARKIVDNGNDTVTVTFTLAKLMERGRRSAKPIVETPKATPKK